MVDEIIPARLHVLLARENSRGVIFRRGPSNQVATFEWERKKDEFKVGQWLKGRIFERRSDLSPDGKYLLYFAVKHQRHADFAGWTAISRAPWLKAISFYGKHDSWEGGGLFLSNTQYWINDRYFREARTLYESKELNRDPNYQPDQYFNAECLGVYYPRLLRDGWVLVERKEGLDVFEKPIGENLVLVKLAHSGIYTPVGKGCYWDEHQIRNENTEELTEYPTWEWADIDSKSIVWASKGGLYRASFNKRGLFDTRLLYDFNDAKFENLIAPYTH